MALLAADIACEFWRIPDLLEHRDDNDDDGDVPDTPSAEERPVDFDTPYSCITDGVHIVYVRKRTI
jgi:hypothetical protein